MSVQFPKRRETDEDAAERVREIRQNNEPQGFDEHGKFLDPTIKKASRQELKKLDFARNVFRRQKVRK